MSDSSDNEYVEAPEPPQLRRDSDNMEDYVLANEGDNSSDEEAQAEGAAEEENQDQEDQDQEDQDQEERGSDDEPDQGDEEPPFRLANPFPPFPPPHPFAQHLGHHPAPPPQFGLGLQNHEDLEDPAMQDFADEEEQAEMARQAHQANFFNPIYPHHKEEDELFQNPPAQDVTSEEILKAELHDFLSKFDEKYGPNIPPFYFGTFEEAKAIAKQTNKFLILYLHSESEEVDLFCREILCSEAVVQILAENFVVWGWDVSSPHRFNILRTTIAKHVTSNLNIFLPKQFPFLCILATINGSLSLLESSSGFVSLDELTNILLSAVQNHEILLEEERQKVVQRDEQRNSRDQLLREQEEAYLQSLEEDRLKEEQRKKEERERQRQEELRKLQLEEEEKRKQEIRVSLPPEPAANCGEPVSNLLFRVPDGRKLQRRFLASSRVRVLFDYLETEGYSVHNGCTVQTNYPKRVIGIDLGATTLKDANLFPQETLFVQNP